MKLVRLAFQRETAMPMLALTFASGVCAALVIARIAWTRDLQYSFLIWNLFLAWLPLAFALLACEKYQQGAARHWRFLALSGAWLLFFPNAPYIFTDLIHLSRGLSRHFWIDMVLILSCALTGLVLGFLSLYLMHSLVRRIVGSWCSWLFVAAVAGLSGIGIYLGRFLRFNSWDIILKPFKLYHGLGNWIGQPLANPRSFAFAVLFATFLFIAYVMLYALTHLQPSQPVPLQNEPGERNQ